MYVFSFNSVILFRSVGTGNSMMNTTIFQIFISRLNGGDTSIPRKASKEATKHYNFKRNARIQCHPYDVNNMLIITKKFKNLSLEDIYTSKDFEDMKRSKHMKMGGHPLILRILKILSLTWPNPTLDLKPLIFSH